MARKKEEESRTPRLFALVAVGIMVLSTLAYAIVSNPFAGEEASQKDSDLDGISDRMEREIGSDPFSQDSVESLEALWQTTRESYINNEISAKEFRARREKIQQAIRDLRAKG